MDADALRKSPHGTLNASLPTPGPWKVSEYHRAVTTATVSQDGCVLTIAETPHVNVKGPTGELARANARLIAAAPELLAALTAILPLADKWYRDREVEYGPSWRGNHPSCVDDARAAIAKATLGR